MVDYEDYMRGEFTGWPHDRDGRLAGIILLDQFTRTFFRRTARAFEADGKALNLALKIIGSKELYKEYTTYEKHFILLPLMHAERSQYQRQCINMLV